MKIYVTDDYKGMSRKAANILSAQVILKPNSVLGLATEGPGSPAPSQRILPRPPPRRNGEFS